VLREIVNVHAAISVNDLAEQHLPGFVQCKNQSEPRDQLPRLFAPALGSPLSAIADSLCRQSRRSLDSAASLAASATGSRPDASRVLVRQAEQVERGPVQTVWTWFRLEIESGRVV
jgi:hypothetical protein